MEQHLTSRPPVFLVDDSPDGVPLAGRAIASAAAVAPRESRTAGAPAEALHAPAAAPPAPVLPEVEMSGADALDVLHRIRAAPGARHLAVLVLTSSAEERDARRAHAPGTSASLQMPQAMRSFRDMLHDALSFRVGWTRCPPEDR